MSDNASHGMLLVDQLEFFNGYTGHGSMWEAEAWYGNDSDKLWLRTEGDRNQGRTDESDVEVFWNHSISAFWGAQWGIRHDFGTGTHRNWTAFGLEGLAPYWVELGATGYLGESGRLAARVRAEYTVRFTQRLILQPELEFNLYNRTDAPQRTEDESSDAQLGLRLRYEITRQCAPYVGLVWTRRFGNAASFAGEEHLPVFDRQFVAGIRFWF
ncbi:MAG TPA: copper resistance protein B [Dyella sp.]|nr:copper resistance protein B [Dyella sp.]